MTRSINFRNPYKILGLSHTCSAEEIKTAYIKLCKKLHPDMKPGDATQHKKFIELNEAYTTLANPKSRHNFDSHFSSSNHHRKSEFWRAEPEINQYEKNAWENEEWSSYKYKEYNNYIRNQSVNSKSKSQNPKQKLILMGCFVLLSLGSVLYLSAYSFATYNQLRKVDEKSKRISEEYNTTHLRAMKENQLEKMKKRYSS